MKAILVIYCLIESQAISNISQLHGVSNFNYAVILNFASACVSQNASIVSLLNLSSGTQMRWFRSNALRRSISSASRMIFVALKFSSMRLHLEVFGITAILSWSRKAMQIWNVQTKKGKHLYYSITMSIVFAYTTGGVLTVIFSLLKLGVSGYKGKYGS